MKKPYTVMTFNILYDDHAPNLGTVEERKDLVISQIREADPDMLGAQECTDYMFNYMCEKLCDDYGAIGEMIFLNRDGSNGWRNPIFYRKSRFELVDSKTQWYSETPDVPYTAFENCSRRAIVHAVLRDKETGEEFVYCNTHMGFKGDELIAQYPALIKMLDSYGNRPRFVTGDMNIQITYPQFALMEESGYKSAYGLTDDHDDSMTFTGVAVLDFCFMAPEHVNVISHKVMPDIGASDHRPVVVKFTLK